MPRRELRATMKLQSETETQRNILKGEMNMLFQTESGQTVGPIGQGTWYLGEDPDRFDAECSALRAGVEAGMNLIDTAEMYGDGAAEELVGRAIQGLDRDKLFLVSKVYPFNAGRGDIRVSCEDSLMRMKTDHLDLYLLHWRGSVPLAETVECMEELKEDGLIRLHIYSREGMQQREQAARSTSHQDCQQQQPLPAHHVFKHVDEEDSGKGAHHHNTFQGDVDDAAPFRIHSADSHNQKRYRKKHGLLYNKVQDIHSRPPLF